MGRENKEPAHEFISEMKQNYKPPLILLEKPVQ